MTVVTVLSVVTVVTVVNVIMLMFFQLTKVYVAETSRFD